MLLLLNPYGPMAKCPYSPLLPKGHMVNIFFVIFRGLENPITNGYTSIVFWAPQTLPYDHICL